VEDEGSALEIVLMKKGGRKTAKKINITTIKPDIALNACQQCLFVFISFRYANRLLIMFL
jgi:hypothetical protein